MLPNPNENVTCPHENECPPSPRARNDMTDRTSSTHLYAEGERTTLTSSTPTESIRPTTHETVRANAVVKTSLLPDWAPWGVLGALLGVGLLGGTGLMPLPDLHDWTAPATREASAATRVVVTGNAKPDASPSASAADEKIEVLHIVVSHAGTQLGKHHNITRTPAEARRRAEEARRRALKGEDFAALIAEYTDEPKASGRNGRIGPFRRKHAIQPFSDVAFALKVGEISAVTETELGIHVIKRTK
jgi:NIMA-interacting peptidyl-prolyl cis-trans isomerase 1